MCGLVGVVRHRGQRVDLDSLGRMTDTLVHRGPDDRGLHLLGDGAVGLGFRRLSIIDLSAGHQPMTNEDGTVWVVFNGEIYNFAELRAELIGLGHTFATRSDTEVLVHGYEAWGEGLLDRIRGMFAFALWDERNRRMLCARDAMGKKPLYYARAPDGLYVASELKALRSFSHLCRELDRESLARYLVHEYVPSPHTIYAGVKKLQPGECLIYQQGGAGTEARLTTRRYWRPPVPRHRNGDAALGLGLFHARGEDQVIARLREEISRAVKRRLVSDVPLGVFLSGGIDSSAVVAFMADHVPAAQIETFSITFDDPSFDEGPFARQVAAALGTQHHEEQLDPATMIAILPQIASVLDEPLGDASIIPTYLLSRFTRRHVTVALGGDGGDELFAGYPTFQAERMTPALDLLPAPLTALLMRATAALPVSTANFSLGFKLRQFLVGAGEHGARRHQVWLGSFAPAQLAGVLSPDVLGAAPRDPLEEIDRELSGLGAPGSLDQLLAFYARYYLADDVLQKVDRASMANSLEVRAPLLDRDLVEYAVGLAPALKLHGLTTKYIFKRAMQGKLPDVIWRRPKKGFGIPVARWLKGELRALGEELLDERRLRQAGLFDPAGVRRLWDEHQAGRADHRKPLWTLLAFELWRDQWL
jgi:asparagine synthase (glutamine-hydrolysing)